jgi:adenylate cyclase
MGVEIERKFLVDEQRWKALKTTGVLYRQGYLMRTEDKTIRIRWVEGEGGFLTIKGKTNGFSRPEYEYPIPEADAAELLQHFCAAILAKKRHQLTINGKLWEVDEFLEDNEGLIVAELELESEQETVELPPWIIKEVTNDKRYYNSELSVNPYINWKP